MSLYRSRPQFVEAEYWDGRLETVSVLNDHTGCKIFVEENSGSIDLYLLAGKNGAQDNVPVPVGHWIVHPPGDTSDIWPVEDEYFRNKYEEQ